MSKMGIMTIALPSLKNCEVKGKLHNSTSIRITYKSRMVWAFILLLYVLMEIAILLNYVVTFSLGSFLCFLLCLVRSSTIRKNLNDASNVKISPWIDDNIFCYSASGGDHNNL